MLRTVLLVSFLVLSALPFVPAADACAGSCDPLPSVCLTEPKCGDADVCASWGHTAPVCVDLPAPCNEEYFGCMPPQSGPGIGPLVGVCVDKTGNHGCYGHHDVCVGFSYEVPFCTDLPTDIISCGPPLCPLPTVPPCAGTTQCVPQDCANCLPVVCVNAKHDATQCDGYDVCVNAFHWVPQCRNVPCSDLSCVSIPDPCSGPFRCVCDPRICEIKAAPDAGPGFGPLVGVCTDPQHTQQKCYGGHDVCVGFSYQVPFCTDLPTDVVSCGAVCHVNKNPVQVCTGTDPCADGHTFCVVVDPFGGTTSTHPICGDCRCIPMNSGPGIGPLVGVCYDRTGHHGCWGQHDICVSGFSWVPQCAGMPTVACTEVCNPCMLVDCPPLATAPVTPRVPHAQCDVLVGSGAAAAACDVNGKHVGPIRTCDTCAVLFAEVCTVGTDAFRCWSS